MKKASESKRTISAETMNSVMTFAPRDGFKLSDAILNKEYTIVDVEEIDFNGVKSFSVTMEDKDGKTITLSASAFKKARVLRKADVEGGEAFKSTENVFTRSNAEEIWNNSVYFHTVGMKKDEEFILPSKVKLRYAVLAEDQETEKPLFNPFLYKGYRKVVNEYAKAQDFPTMEDFKEELNKSAADGRIKGLPSDMTKPTLQSWVKEDDVANYRHTLIIEDYEE